MSQPMVVPGIMEATLFLREMPAVARQRGEAYFRNGRVISLEATPNDPNEFSAVVRGSHDYEVWMDFDSNDGWLADCTCPLGADCKHIYAAMKTLLAEHSAGRVNQLSSGAGVTEAKPKKPARKLADDLEKAVGRPLMADEKKYLAKLAEIFRAGRARNAVYEWELAQVALKIPERPWPRFLESEDLFWNYLAYTTISGGGRIPAFMEPITKTDEIEQEVARWRRQREIQDWQMILERTAPPSLVPAAEPSRYELRARFSDRSVLLEWRRPGRDDFERMKPMQVRNLRSELDFDRAELSPESVLLWELFMRRLDQYGSAEIPYHDARQMKQFARLFKLPALAPLLVTPDGQPFARSEEVLRWHLEPAQSEDDNYALRIARADGSPLRSLLVVLHGTPTLYLTRDTAFRGPPAEDTAFSPQAATLIPAPALETKAGATLLLGMGVEMPPRLRDRVRAIPLHLALSCGLAESFPGSSSEVCSISARVINESGDVVQTWNGYSWENVEEQNKRDRRNEITVYDRSGIHDPRILLTGLDARWDGYAGTWTLRVTKKFPEQFVSWLESVSKEIKVELKGELASLTQQTIAGTLKLDVAEAGIDWFDLRVILDIADTTLSQDEIKLLLNARGGYVRLKDKGWRRLEFKLSQEEDEQLARLGLNPRALTSEPQRLHALQLADKAAKRFLPELQYERIERRATELKARVTPPIPATIRAELRPYQEQGFHFLAYLAENRFGGILADDMGLGKTLQALTWLEWLRSGKGSPIQVASTEDATPDVAVPRSGRAIAPSLVVCPKSVMDNWRAEGERFLPSLRVKIWSPDDLASFKENVANFDLHVLNYSQLRIMGEGLAPIQWLAVILDEGQYIKNPSSITAQIARALRAEYRLVLSGTPIENRLLDLWSLMAFAMPGVLGSRAQFGKLYDAKEDPFARRRLSARVRPFLLRRTKSQVAKDLPDRIEEDLLCEIEGEQKTLYRAELKRAQQMLLSVQTQKQLAKERFHFLTSLLRLRQICCHPKLIKGDSKAPSAKVEALFEQLEPLIEEGQKVLVFSQFVSMLDLLRAEIEPRQWPLYYLAGDTENRGELVQNFQSAQGAAVFLISLKAGGFGLNLTAASYVVLFDPWWNPAVENQAIDRTHRIGQKANVIAYRLLIKNSIEEKIRTLQKTKSALADDVLGEEKFAQSLTIEDLQFLFSDT